MKRIILLISIILLTIPGSFAQKDSLKILFVGNSYTFFENLPQIVSGISDQTKTKLITKKSTAGGARLSEHWNGKKGLRTKEVIKNGNYDIVILQEHSLGTIDEPDSIRKYGKLFCDLIRENKATPYFYLTWAREKTPQTQETINQVYTDVAAQNKAIVVPVGKAWALARQLRPDIKLYTSDGSHPCALGTFLTACVFVASISNEIPDKLPTTYMTTDITGESVILMKVSKTDVAFCQKIAKEVAFKDRH